MTLNSLVGGKHCFNIATWKNTCRE